MKLTLTIDFRSMDDMSRFVAHNSAPAPAPAPASDLAPSGAHVVGYSLLAEKALMLAAKDKPAALKVCADLGFKNFAAMKSDVAATQAAYAAVMELLS